MWETIIGRRINWLTTLGKYRTCSLLHLQSTVGHLGKSNKSRQAIWLVFGDLKSGLRWLMSCLGSPPNFSKLCICCMYIYQQARRFLLAVSEARMSLFNHARMQAEMYDCFFKLLLLFYFINNL